MEMKELDVQCILPPVGEQNLVGMVLLSSGKRGKNYGYDELNEAAVIGHHGQCDIQELFLLKYAHQELVNKAGTQLYPVLAPLFVEQIKAGTIKPIIGEENKGKEK